MNPKLSKYLCYLMLAATVFAPCQVTGSENRLISLDVENQNLAKVFELLSRQSGYRITISQEVHKVPISIKIEKANLKAAIKEIFRNLGNLNYFEIRNEQERSIDLLVVGFYANELDASEPYAKRTIENPRNSDDTISEVGLTQIKQQYRKEKADRFMLSEILPAENGEAAVTLADVLEVKSQYHADKANGSGSGYIFPPAGDDDRGLTEAEVNALKQDYQKAKQAQTDSDLISLPGEQAEDAVTIGEIKKIKAAYESEKRKQSGSTKIMLPGDTAETAVTVQQIEAIKKAHKESLTTSDK